MVPAPRQVAQIGQGRARVSRGRSEAALLLGSQLGLQGQRPRDLGHVSQTAWEMGRQARALGSSGGKAFCMAGSKTSAVTSVIHSVSVEHDPCAGPKLGSPGEIRLATWSGSS